MGKYLLRFFAVNLQFIADGNCDLWKENLVLLHITFDSLIYSIFISLFYVWQKRRNFSLKWIRMQMENILLFRGFQGEIVQNLEIALAPENEPKDKLLASGQQFLAAQGKRLGAVVGMHNIAESKAFEQAQTLANEELDRRFKVRTRVLRNVVKQLQKEIVKRKQVEAVLKESEEQFRSLVSNIPGIIYRCAYNSDWTMSLMSDAIKDICGYPASDFIHNQVRTFASIIHPEDLGMVEQVIQEGVAKKQPYILEYRLIKADGSVIWVLEKGQGIFNGTGEVLYLDGAIFDITERKLAEQAQKQAEEELRQTEAQLYKESRHATVAAQEQARMLEVTLSELRKTQAQLIQTEKMSSLGQLVAGVAHEINNPVNFIYGNLIYINEYITGLLNLVKLYQEYYPDPAPAIQAEVEVIDFNFLVEDLPKMLSSMKVGAERIRKIVLSLRNFSRLDQAEMKKVDIHEGLDNTLLLLQNRLKLQPEYPAIEIIKEYGNLPLVECYAGQLNQVFMNILTNAIDALDDFNKKRSLEQIKNHPSTIRICTEVLDNHHVLIRIADNGPGMSESVRSRLFDPFFTTKPIGQGIGLGLSISYSIVVEKHHGQLQCFAAPNQGTEFFIQIPTEQRYCSNRNSARF